MNLWLNYPLRKAMKFLAEVERYRNFEVRSHVLRIGPLAFCVMWKAKKVTP